MKDQLLNGLNKYSFLHIEKIVQIFSYIQKYSKTTSKIELIKYLFFADRLNIRKHFSFISLDNYVALKYGPVASTSLDILNHTKDYLNNYSQNELKFLNKIKRINQSKRIIEPVNDDLLSKNEMRSLDTIMNLFCDKPLIALSHDYPEWKRYKELFENKLISMHPVNINDFFSNPDINDSPVIKKYFSEDPFYEDLEYLKEAKEFYFESFQIDL
jgi:hypothetical protein